MRRPRRPARKVPVRSEAVQAEIRDIAAGGAGVGTLPDGRTVFVQRTAPGDRVQLRVVEDHERWARGLLEAVLEPGPDRRPAPCVLYDRCGGCTLQHISYDAQLEAKGGIVAQALRRIGGRPVDAPVVDPSPREQFYRSRITLTLIRRPGGAVVAGFHALDRPGRIVDMVDECLLPEPALLRVWTALRQVWGEGARRLPAGDQLRLTLRAADGGVVLTAQPVGGGGGGMGDAGGLLADVPELLALWWLPADRSGPVLLAGDPDTVLTWQGIQVPVRTTAFLQVNREAADDLHQATLRAMGSRPQGLRVVDAYCGAALFGRRLAHHGARVIGIELDPEGAMAARAGEALPLGGGSFQLLEGRVEDRLQEALPADLVLVNPPRTGLDPKVPRLLREARVPRILYVSCDPATLARDIQRLGPGYGVGSLRSFDLFPMTSHVETLAVLSLLPPPFSDPHPTPDGT